MFTITTRLTLGNLISFGLVMSIIAALTYLIFAANERATLDQGLRDYAGLLIDEVDTRTANVSDLFDKLEEVTGQANLRFRSMRFVLLTNDSLIFEGDSQMEPLADTLESVLKTGDPSRFHTLDLGSAEYRVYSQEVWWHGNKEELQLVVIGSMARLQEALANFRRFLMIIVPSAVLLASIGGWLTARRALRPVSVLRETAAAITTSNLHERVPIGTSNDELSDLATTFNEMIARIEETFNAQRRFVADASHDLRTPLMVIQTKLDRLLRLSDLTEPVRDDLRHCQSEVEHLARIASDLLVLARAESHQLQLAHDRNRLDELLMECVEKMSSIAHDRQIGLRLDIDDPVLVVCDRPMLQRVLMNILDNAIAYSPDNGTIAVHLAEQEGVARLTVTDDGPGIPAEDLPHIFDRFYRSDRTRTTRGSGLGLAIAKTIIEAHGGTVAITSELGSGTSVIVTLPLA
ncbi:MAG TPA: ATP-binding protein [Candidatus Kapabacteria bacterium]|nr:ATP-binding protein [Candidatus Kapabacteria bacterium]